jgi:hypothetical protein
MADKDIHQQVQSIQSNLRSKNMVDRKEILEKIQKDVFKREDTDHAADVDQIYRF